MLRLRIDDAVQCNDTPDMKMTLNLHGCGVSVAHFLCLASCGLRLADCILRLVEPGHDM
jgi:hypothetical protein